MHAKASDYRLTASNGRHIRIATQVVFADGCVIRFMDRLSKSEAVRLALKVREKE